LVQHTLLDHGPWGIINNLSNCPNLWTWRTTLKHQWLFPSIVKGQWHAWSKFSLHKSLEFAWRHPHIWTWLLPFSSSHTTLFGPCDGLLQNGLCFFYQDWFQTNILWIFHGMVTSLGYHMALTRPHKRCRQPQNFTRHNKSQSGGWGGKIKFSFVFDILCNDTNTKPMFCKHITHMQSHGISKCSYNFKKSNSYMTRFSHLSFKKYTIRTKVSTPTLDIQRSKLVVQVIHKSKVGDINLALFFFAMATFSKRSSLYWHLDGKRGKDLVPKLIYQKMVLPNQHHNPLSNQQYNILFKLFLVKIIFVVNNTTTKDCKNIGRGWAKPFFVHCFSILGPFFCCSI